MRRELILHIGITKTGSSSIQRALLADRAALREQGVYVPTSPGAVSHNLLPALLTAKPLGFGEALWEGISPAARLAQFREEFQAEMNDLPAWATRCIITSELLSTRLNHNSQLDGLRDMLVSFFDPIRVIVYLRRQDQHVASYYNELVRAGQADAPDLAALAAPRWKLLNYDAMLARFARAFGKAAMEPRIFSREALRNGDVVADFYHLAGLRPPIEAAQEARLSISWEGQQLMFGVAAVFSDEDKVKRWWLSPAWNTLAEAISRSNKGSGWRPTEAEATTLMGQFARGNEVVRAAYFPDQESLFSTDFSNLPKTPMKIVPQQVLKAALSVLVNEAIDRSKREAASCMAQYHLYRRLDDKAGMRQMLVNAIQHAPDLLAPRLSMASLCLDMGQARLAREHAQVAVDLEPEHKGAAHLLRLSKQRLAKKPEIIPAALQRQAGWASSSNTVAEETH